MNVNRIVLTLWFDKVIDIKNKVELFESGLKRYFAGINVIGVPADISPDYPRLTAISDGGHSKLSISMINYQLVIDYDEKYENDIEKVYDYLKSRVLESFDILTKIIGLRILYGAVLVISNSEVKNPINKVKTELLSSKFSNDYCDLGVRYVKKYNDKFYKNVTINTSKKIFIKQNKDAGNIILPLLSLRDANIEKEGITINYEINDKYSYDTKADYNMNKDDLELMIDTSKEDISSDFGYLIK